MSANYWWLAMILLIAPSAWANNPAKAVAERAKPPVPTCRTDTWARLSFYHAANAASVAALRPQVIFMGDSITQGWQSQPFIQRNLRFAGRGIGGQTAPQMLVRFHADVIALKPQVVHILAGTNDVAKNTGAETDEDIEGYIASMAELARANGIKVLLASILPALDYPWQTGLHPVPRIKRLNAWIKDYAARNSLVYVDYWPAMATPEGRMKPELSEDGVHPNASGYAAMQPLASAAIERALGDH